jgi:uncharacterized protein (DUF4415 family)
MPTSKRSGEKRVSLKATKGKRVKPLLKRDSKSGFLVEKGRSISPTRRPFHPPRLSAANTATQLDPDDAPVLTKEFFERADVYHGDKLVRAGRPQSANPKLALKLRIDPDVVEYFRATGPGWQTRINDTLRKAAKLPTKPSRFAVRAGR